MKIKEAIKMANLMEKGNVLEPELAILFLSELDGMIQSDIMLCAPEEIVSYDNQEQELLLKPPHDKLYVHYLVMMIRNQQQEYEGYQNSQKSVDEKLKTFKRWYIQHYRPADTASRSYSGGTSADAFGFAYLTAYGLAVRHGYSGTEEEWLASLEGQPGDPGAAARMRFDAERGVIQWGVEDAWYDLFTLEELKDPIVEELMQEVRTALEDAEAAATHAADSEAAAKGHARMAADAAADALGSAGRAYASEQNTVTAWGDAQVQAETAEGYALRAEAAAKKAEEAAAGVGTGGNGSGQNVTIDTTLTQSGQAADAKAVGDALDELESKIPSIEGLAKEEDIPTKPEDIGAQPKGNYASPDDIPKVPNWAMQDNKPAYTASEVGADPNGAAASAVSTHNANNESHSDIRLEIKTIREQLAAFLDTDEETLNELSELIARIVANQTSIAQLTTGKVNVTDIIDNLTTNVANKPMSAAQGVALKTLVDNISTSLANYQPKGSYALASAVPTKVSQLANDKGYLTEHQDISGKADKFDPTVYGLPVLWLTGDTAPIAVSKDNKVTMSYTHGERSGTCTLKGQGATSYKTAQALVKAGKAGKFNYTIKFDNAFEAKEGWGAQQKYCLKANFIDPTQSRNICSCKLWGMSTKARSVVPPELANLPNGGAIDGFPIIIMLNGEFHGLYTWNIPKDGWMCGLVEDPTKTQAIVSASDHTAATQFKEASMSGFEVEFVSDENNADWVEQSLTRMISAVINSDGSDLDTTVAQYLDWDSWIDHFIHAVVDKADDCVDKNYNLVTFDGVKWYVFEYDRDSIWGLLWDASGLTRPVSNCSFTECAATVRVYELILRFKTNRLKARYKELRGNILSESRIMQVVENFAWAIPSPVKLEDVKKYPTILGSDVNTIDQIGRFVRQRLETSDKWEDALPAQEEPPAAEPDIPVGGYTNLVPTSTDTDGSIYNGTGYKDNARLSSSGGVSSSAQTGSVVTGFIPFKNTDTVRMKGAIWEHQDSKHYYFSLYDANKTFVPNGYVAAQTMVGNEGVKSQFRADYDATTGVTTFQIIDPTGGTGELRMAAKSAAYFRINAYGKGADLIITVNQEITE